MSDEPLLTVAREEGVARITLSRPKALNALNSALLRALHDEIVGLAADDSLRCVVITGAGDRAFVAGADIAEMVDLGPQAARRFSERGHRTFDALSALPVPVIAAVNGFCLGGGCELALACDLIYASEKAQFGQPEVKLGLIPGFGGTQRLARRVGDMRAAELVFTGRMVGATEARAMGLCLEVFPPERLLDEVMKIARDIAARGPVAVRAAKVVQARGLEAPLATANAYERDAFALLFDSADAREGMRAFLARREAQFTNQ